MRGRGLGLAVGALELLGAVCEVLRVELEAAFTLHTREIDGHDGSEIRTELGPVNE